MILWILNCGEGIKAVLHHELLLFQWVLEFSVRVEARVGRGASRLETEVRGGCEQRLLLWLQLICNELMTIGGGTRSYSNMALFKA